MKKILNISIIFSLIFFSCKAINKEVKEFYPSGKIKKLYYVKGEEFIGRYTEYYENGGIRLKGTFQNGYLTDTLYFYYEDGRLFSKTSYKKGEKDGAYIAFYLSGDTLEKGEYSGNLMNNDWFYYDSTRNLIRTIRYAVGKRVGKSVKYSNNMVDSVYIYWNDSLIQSYKEW